MVVLDTNILIDHLRQSGKNDSILTDLIRENPKETIAISMISIQELYEGKSTKQEEKEKDMLAIVAPLKILPYSFEVAKLAGQISRDLPQPIELADAAIAATTILNGGKLMTLNRRDFNDISRLDLVPLKP